MMDDHLQRLVGLFLLGLSIALSLILAGLVVWANGEAAYYGFPHMTNNHLTTLRCPHFMAADETAWIRATVRNTTDHPTTVGIKSWLSVWDLQTDYRQLRPGERWLWARRIGPQNRDLQHFILASVYVFGGYPMPERQSMCGMYVLPVRGVRGEVVMWTGGVLALLFLVSGWWLWRRGGGVVASSVLAARMVSFTLVLVPLTLAAAVWMNWVVGLVVLVVDVLLVVIVGLSSLMHTA